MTPLPEPLKTFAYLGGMCQDLYSEAQLREYGAAEYKRAIDDALDVCKWYREIDIVEGIQKLGATK